MKRLISISIFFTLSLVVAFSQEKLYLHLERDMFVPGELVRFKGYITDCADTDSTSNFIYVELLKDTIINRVKIKKSGKGFSGALLLQDNLSEGNYILRAYSRYQMNRSPKYMYHTQINICTSDLPKPQIAAKDSSISIEFYPQGGAYFDGEHSLIAFHTTYSNGNSVSIKGELINGSEVLQTIQSDANGRGSFTFFPLPSKKYHIQVYLNDSLHTFPLPPSSSSSVAVSVNNTQSKNIGIKIHSTLSNNKESYHLALFNNKGSALLHSFSGDTTLSKVFLIPRVSISNGVNYAVAFSDAGEIKSVRPFYNYKNSINPEYIKLSAELSKNDSGNTLISAQLLDAQGKGVQGDFSISILPASNKQFLSKDNIYSYLNLLSEIPYKINTDTLYFNSNLSLTQQLINIENLLLTQDDFYYPLKETISEENIDTLSKEFTQRISCSVLSKNKKDKGYILSLFDPISESVFISEIPANRHFIIEDLDIPDGRTFVLNATNNKGKKRRLRWEPELLAKYFDYQSLYPILTENIQVKYKDTLGEELISFDKLVEAEPAVNTLNEVVITEDRLIRPKRALSPYSIVFEKRQMKSREELSQHDDMEISQYISLLYPGFLNIDGTLYSNRAGVIKMTVSKEGKISIIASKEEVQLYVDGVRVDDWNAVKGMRIKDVENLHVLRGNEGALYQTIGGVVLLDLNVTGTTKNNDSAVNTKLLISPLGYDTEKYDDYLTPNTLYWNPNIIIDQNGIFSVKINRTHKDNDEYVVKIEGVTSEGESVCVVKTIPQKVRVL